MLLGNAWADAMQDRLGVQETGKERSLDGDCLTGAWTRSTLPEPKRQGQALFLSAGDLDEGVIVVPALRRRRGGHHVDQVGTVFDRIGLVPQGHHERRLGLGIG